MKATHFAQYGGPEVLELVEVAEPHPVLASVHRRARGRYQRDRLEAAVG